MALFIPGLPCRLCGKPVASGEERLFPAFCGNEADSVYFYNDAVVHQSCFERDPLAPAVEARLQESLATPLPAHQPCSVCGNLVSRPDEFFSFGHLTNDAGNRMHAWNYLSFHRECVGRWPELPSLIGLAEAELASGRWQGPGPTLFVEELKNGGRLLPASRVQRILTPDS